MSLTNITPSTGATRATGINLNRMRLRPGDLVVYWSAAAAAPKIDRIDAYASQDGNFFTINGERLIVTAIWARIPTTFDAAQRAAVIADFAAIGRPTLSMAERIAICHRHWLDD